MEAVLSIGDFARATQLSAKALRHDHQVGLLRPVRTDPDTGYRYYAATQISTARLIRRFRDLDLPLDEIRTVVTTDDVSLREQTIHRHLVRLESGLQRTQDAVRALRGVLDGGSPTGEVTIRRVEATEALAIVAEVTPSTLAAWFRGALAELTATADALGVTPTGAPGASVPTRLFADEVGELTLFLPVAERMAPIGRVRPITVPGGEFAVTEHHGSHVDVDRSYGRLGEFVARSAFGLDEPVREYYRAHPPAEDLWRTEICWPVLALRA